jgi:hypothetical protein
MLLKILKLAGLDIPAKIEAAKASLELRVEQATDHVRQVAQEAAVVAALAAIAAVTGGMAAGVGLIALYRWTADGYGVYAGLAVVGAILVAVTVILAAVATIKARSLAPRGARLPHYAGDATVVTSDPGVIAGASAADVAVTEPYSSAAQPWAPPAAATFAVRPASANDLAEPLAFFLSKVVKYPRIGNPMIDELIGNLRTTAYGTTNEAIDGAANVIRHGNRANLIVVLTGAAFVGWLLSHHSRQ